jgi:hypothetical protein
MKTKMLGILLLAAPLLAAPPRIAGGEVRMLGSLENASSVTNGWIGYQIETTKSFSSCGCSLTSDNNNITNIGDSDDIGPANRSMLLFARVREGRVDRMRFFSPDCTLSAKNQTVYWVDRVTPAESIAFLRNEATDTGLLAMSMQEGGIDALIDIARNNPSSRTRGKALFWLSQAAGEKAAAALRQAVDNDPEAEVKSKAVFGISQLPNDQSIPLLIDLLKHHRSREVRKKAAFWLGQKNDPRAVEAIADILRQ